MLKKVSGLVCYVQDLAATKQFYESLDFQIDASESTRLSVELGDFWLDFHPQDLEDKPEFQREANAERKGAGLFLYVLVDNVDNYYQTLLAKQLQPSSEPRNWPWGNREFVIRDPDGYKIVFYHKLTEQSE